MQQCFSFLPVWDIKYRFSYLVIYSVYKCHLVKFKRFQIRPKNGVPPSVKLRFRVARMLQGMELVITVGLRAIAATQASSLYSGEIVAFALVILVNKYNYNGICCLLEKFYIRRSTNNLTL